MTTLYPIGYGTQLVPMTELRRVHEPKMHPEFSRRIWPWLESMGGLLGIGDGWRPTPDPISEASMRGESFHQYQTFRSGIVAYCAVDMVARNPGKVHRAPRWSESATAPGYGLHTFIGETTSTTSDDEPWHLQPLEIRGWATWVNDGRPDPPLFDLPVKAEDMEPLPRPERVYDSRETGGQFAPGEIRSIPVGMCTRAFVHITAVSDGIQRGYISVSGTDTPSDTSIANLDADGIASGGAPVGVPDGRVRVRASAPCHVIVDVFARG